MCELFYQRILFFLHITRDFHRIRLMSNASRRKGICCLKRFNILKKVLNTKVAFYEKSDNKRRSIQAAPDLVRNPFLGKFWKEMEIRIERGKIGDVAVTTHPVNQQSDFAKKPKLHEFGGTNTVWAALAYRMKMYRSLTCFAFKKRSRKLLLERILSSYT